MVDKGELDRAFPSNSKYQNVTKNKSDPSDKPAEKVASGRVVAKKKSLMDKFAETFLASDMETVAKHILFDVLIPEAKNMLGDIIHGTTNMMLWGDRRGNRMTRDPRDRSFMDRERVDYSRCADNRGGRDNSSNDRPRYRNIVEDIVYTTRGDAEDVIDSMKARIRQYGVVTVKDLYIFSDIRAEWTTDNYGWFNLDEAYIDRVQTGYLLRLPKPEAINQ